VGVILTGKFEHVALNTDDFLVDTIDDLHHAVHGLLAATVHLEQSTLEGLALGVICIAVESKCSRTAEELGQSVKLLAQCFLGGLGCIGDGICADSFQLLLVRLGELSFLSNQTLLILGSKLFVVGDLLFCLGDGSLESGPLEVLCLLVVVDLLFLDELVQRFSRVLGDDSINLCAGILSNVQVRDK
jgi:hypothetical protein